jgi:hypothetical protein
MSVVVESKGSSGSNWAISPCEFVDVSIDNGEIQRVTFLQYMSNTHGQEFVTLVIPNPALQFPSGVYNVIRLTNWQPTQLINASLLALYFPRRYQQFAADEETKNDGQGIWL